MLSTDPCWRPLPSRTVCTLVPDLIRPIEICEHECGSLATGSTLKASPHKKKEEESESDVSVTEESEDDEREKKVRTPISEIFYSMEL